MSCTFQVADCLAHHDACVQDCRCKLLKKRGLTPLLLSRLIRLNYQLLSFLKGIRYCLEPCLSLVLYIGALYRMWSFCASLTIKMQC